MTCKAAHAEDWREAHWGDLIELAYGKALGNRKQAGGHATVFGTNGPTGDTSSEAQGSGPTIVIGRKGAYRGVKWAPGPFWVIDTAFYVVPKVDFELEWAFRALTAQDINALDSGSAIPSTRREDVYQLPVLIPPDREQGRIAAVLRAIDQKIEGNRRLAKTLERIADALFKARFIDFVDHEDLVEGENGPIPRGWSTVDIYEAASVTYGRPFKSSLFDNSSGLPLLRIRDLATHSPRVRTTENRDDGRLVETGDIVVGMDGEFRAHLWSGPDSWLNQRVCVFDPLPGVSRAFLLGAIRIPLAFFEATKTGTTVIHLGKRDIDTFRIVCPPDSVMESFRREADPLLLSAVTARKQTHTLSAIRDRLLPRLISGQIRVSPDGELVPEAA